MRFNWSRSPAGREENCKLYEAISMSSKFNIIHLKYSFLSIIYLTLVSIFFFTKWDRWNSFMTSNSGSETWWALDSVPNNLSWTVAHRSAIRILISLTSFWLPIFVFIFPGIDLRVDISESYQEFERIVSGYVTSSMNA